MQDTQTHWKQFLKQACERQLQHEEDEAMAIAPGSFMSAEELEEQRTLLMQRIQAYETPTEPATQTESRDSPASIESFMDAGRRWWRITAEGLEQLIRELEPDDSAWAVGFREGGRSLHSTPFPSRQPEPSPARFDASMHWLPTQKPRAYKNDCFRLSLKYHQEPFPTQVPSLHLKVNGQAQRIEQVDYRGKFGMLHVIVYGSVPEVIRYDLWGTDMAVEVRLTI